MLLDQDPRRKRLDRVIVSHRHGRLHHNWTAIELAGYEMHRRAAHFDAMFERLTLRFHAGERRQQRRVDVQDGIRKRLEHRRTDQPHEASETHDADMALLQFRHDGSIEIHARGEASVIEHQRLDPCGARSAESGRIGTVGYDDANARAQPALSYRVDERLKIAAAP